jgi:hypothetical protein
METMMHQTTIGYSIRIGAVSGLLVLGLATASPGASGDDPRAAIAAAEATAFTQADTDGSGTLTADEFANYGELLRAQLEALHFTRLDTNGDGVLTKEEIETDRRMGPPPGPPAF